MPKPNGIVYQDLSCECKGVKEDGTLEAAISSNAVDRMGEVLDPSGVDLRNYRKNPVVLWAHDYEKPPIAKALWVKRDGDRILSKLKFAPTEFAQEVKALYEQGFMNTFSVGFMPKEWVDGDGDKNPRRTYKSWELLEYSAVPVPANPEALALAMQKGIIKDPSWNDLITKKEEKLQEFNNEEKEAEEVKDTKSLDELLAENKSLSDEIIRLQAENGDLRWKVYALTQDKQKRLLEMAEENVVKKVEDVTLGVIRKLQGKLD